MGQDRDHPGGSKRSSQYLCSTINQEVRGGKPLTKDLGFGRGVLNQPKRTGTGSGRCPSMAMTSTELGRGRTGLSPDAVTEGPHRVRGKTGVQAKGRWSRNPDQPRKQLVSRLP